MPFVPDTPASGGGQFVPDAPEWSDIPGNIVKGLAEAPSELTNIVKGLATPWPMRAMQAAQGAAAQYAAGKAPSALVGGVPGGPVASGLVDTAKNWGAGELLSGDVSGAGQQAKQNIIEHPIKSALDVATVAAPFMAPEASTVEGALKEGATRASRFAQEQSVKSLEGAIGQVRQLGPEEARAVGQLALDKGIVSPFTPTSLGMERALNSELEKTGAEIGASRAAGDLAGGAPSAAELQSTIEGRLANRYGSGMRSGETGSLEKALDEVGKIGKPEVGIGPVEGPSFVRNAEKATEMNAFASKNKMLQPTGAFTDVSNALSHENNAALQKALTPEQWTAYQGALNDFSGLKSIEKFFSRGEARELAGRGSGMLTDIYKGAKDVIGHKALAAGADTVANMLSSPAVAKSLPTLINAAKAGPAALEATHSILQKNDPEYAEQTKDFASVPDNASVQNSPEAIMAHVASNPQLAPYESMFQEASQRGPQAVVANHFTLMQRDPAYNKAFTMPNQNMPPMHYMLPPR